MTGGDLALLATAAGLVLVAAGLVAVSTALIHDEHRVRLLLDGRARGRHVLVPLAALWVVAITAAVTVVTVAVERSYGPSAVLVGWLGLTGLTVAAVVTAQILALPRAGRITSTVAPVVSRLGTSRLVGLVVSILSAPARLFSRIEVDEHAASVSERDLVTLAEVAEDEAVIEQSDRALIASAVAFGSTTVREVMVPRLDMVTVPDHVRSVDAMEIVIMHGFSRVPVIKEGLDDIVGVVYAKDLMRAEQDGEMTVPVGRLARTTHFVPETTRLSNVLRDMQADRYHLAIVVDEYGGTAGLVTLEDLLEELVGEIVDEFDQEEPMLELLPEGAVRVNGRLPVAELNAMIDAEVPTGDWVTVGGLVYKLLGHVPVSGETATVEGYRFVAERIQGHRIRRVAIYRPDGTDDGSVAENDRARLADKRNEGRRSPSQMR